jgi:large subunit ribosomal protein L9
MAQAILLKDVGKLGKAGEAIDVSPGYLRNYLQPRKLAQPATAGALEDARRRAEAAERAAQEAADRAEETAALLSKTVLTIQHRAGEDGKLYGSVTTKEIAEAIGEARGLRIDRKKIRLDDPIREVGTYMIEVELQLLSPGICGNRPCAFRAAVLCSPAGPGRGEIVRPGPSNCRSECAPTRTTTKLQWQRPRHTFRLRISRPSPRCSGR